MRILSVEETVDLVPLGKGKFNWVYRKLSQLKVGEGLEILYTDWKTKNTPYVTIRTVEKNLNRKFEYGRHPNGNAWLAIRVS